MQIGDRVEYKTMGGWYNSGIIKDMDDDCVLIEVDRSPVEIMIFTFYVRAFKNDVRMIDEKHYLIEGGYMKLYIERCYGDNKSGFMYLLKNKEGEILNNHVSSNDDFAKLDLIRNHPEWENADLEFITE